MGDGWRKQLRPGDVVLVVDVGGGTTDFSAIAAVEKEGSLELVRVAVGDHILLGGDNMDLALAHLVRQKLEREGKAVDRGQHASLVHACRTAKERLFGEPSLDAAPIAIASRGAALLGGTLRTELTREEVTRTIVDGFFPIVAGDARPSVRPRGGLTEIGLPYASEPAVTRHLSAFLARQAGAVAKLGLAPASGKPARLPPSHCAPVQWRRHEGRTAPRPRRRHAQRLARLRRRGAGARPRRRRPRPRGRPRGMRLRPGPRGDGACASEAAPLARITSASRARSLPSLGVDPPLSAMCVAPFGMEEGTEAQLPAHEFGVVVGEPVCFRFYGSSVRRDDGAGAVLEDWTRGELEELPPMELILPADGRHEGDVVPVRGCAPR